MSSYRRMQLATDTTFQLRVLILFINYAHDVMNLTQEDEITRKLQAKAQELLNQPDSFKERLSFSVAALLDDAYVDNAVEDGTIELLVEDIFDGIAGVSSTKRRNKPSPETESTRNNTN